MKTMLAAAVLGLLIVPSMEAADARAQSGDGLTVQPAALTLLTGETAQLSAEGGAVPPLSWSSSDPSVLSISSAGLATAVAPGQARAIVTDADGRRGYSAVYQVGHLELQVLDASVRNSQAPFTVAIRGAFTPWPISAFELTLAFDPAVIAAVGAETEGTLAAGWGAPTVAVADGSIRVAHAGAAALSGSGDLVGVVLRLKPGLESGETTMLSLVKVRLNEGEPIARGGTGQVTVRGGPVVVSAVTVAPATVAARPNTLTPFTASVVSTGTGQVVWSVLEGAAHGTIDEAGVYRAPAQLPVPAAATVVATSLEDASVAGPAAVTLLPPLEAGLVQLAVLRNPANAHSLQLLVSAAEAFLGPPSVTVNGQAATVSAVAGSLAVYRAHAWLPAAAATATIHAAGTTAAGAGEAELVVTF